MKVKKGGREMNFKGKINYLTKNRLVAILILLSLTLGLFSACTSKNSGNSSENKSSSGVEVNNEAGENLKEDKEDDESKIMEDFEDLLAKGSLKEVLDFIEKNIPLVSSEKASNMVSGLKELHLRLLPEVEYKFYESDSLQEELIELYIAGEDINKADNLKNEKSKELLEEVLETGYKVETAEGSFFPVVNYEFYKKYKDFVTPDMKEYIDLLAVESNEPPAKDAGLVITWEEVLDRAEAQAKFLDEYKDSAKVDEIEKLYGWYLRYVLFGLDNTPLFEYQTNEMNMEAKGAYMNALDGSSRSSFLRILKDYMDIMEENGYKLTNEVEEYRSSIIKDFE